MILHSLHLTSHRTRVAARKISLWAFASLLVLSTAQSHGQATKASVLTSPDPGSTFSSSEVTFEWEDVQATGYILRLGSTKDGLDLHNSGVITETSRTVTGLPTDTVVHATLWTRAGTSSSYYLRNFVYNNDLDDDGIEDAIDPNPGVPDPKVTLSGVQDAESYTLTLLGSGRVASLEVSQTRYDSLITGQGAPPHLAMLSKMVLNELRDRFDFILFVSDEDSFPSGIYSGIHGGVQNDTTGIARSIFDNTATYGSAGRLQSVIHLTSKLAIVGGPSLHEIMHRWGNHNYLATTVSAHWGYSNIGGQLGGWADGTLESLDVNLYKATNGRTTSFGTFANGGNAQPFGPLELYLMGLIEAEEVHDIEWAINPAPTVPPVAGQFTADSIETRTMAEMIGQHGRRMPGPADSQKEFTALWVVVTTSPLSNGRWASYDRDVHDISYPGAAGGTSLSFWQATGGRARLKSDGVLEADKNFLPPAHIAGLSRNGAEAFIRFFGESGVTYNLEQSENLGIWNEAGPAVVGNDQETEITHPITGNPTSGFYRLAYELTPAAPLATEMATESMAAPADAECTACGACQHGAGDLYNLEIRH